MNRTKYILVILSLLLTKDSLSQTVSCNVQIVSSSTGEDISNATVFVVNNQWSGESNEYGFINLSLVRGSSPILVSKFGYQDFSKVFEIDRDTSFSIALEDFELETVEVVGGSEQREIISSFESIPMAKLLKVPAIGSEADPLKALSLLPGVAQGNEGSSSLYVRGGTPDQNLILLDHVPVFNVNHLGGYLSVFNPLSIQSLKFHKGGFPSKYGGRIASVLDIKGKEGNNQELKGEWGIGLLSSKARIEGPLKKGKSSFILATRNSYLGLINLFRDKENAENFLNYWLYDVNAKANFTLKKGKLYFAFYNGFDFGETQSIGGTSTSLNGYTTKNTFSQNIKWGNRTFSARYTRPLGKAVFWRSVIGYTKYAYRFKEKSIDEIFFENNSTVEENFVEENRSISSLIVKSNIDYSPNRSHLLSAGINFEPQNFNAFIDSAFVNRAMNLGLYAQDEIKFSSNISGVIGLRYSLFANGGLVFGNFEPRMKLSFGLSDQLKINTSLSRMVQPIHLLSSISFGFPNDIWFPATSYAEPAKSNQASIEFSFQKDKNLNVSLSGYYKFMTNLIDVKPGLADFRTVINSELENSIEANGNGRSFGMEFFQSQSIGKWNYSIGYTLAKTDRRFENINNGESFPFQFDRRHDLMLFSSYNFNKEWWVSLSYIYQSGRRISLPTSRIPKPFEAGSELVYDQRNNGSFPNYHRLDVSVNKEILTKRNNKLGWNLSIYNVYNRKNTTYAVLRNDRIQDNQGNILKEGDVYLEQQAGFPILPSLSVYLKY